MLARRGAAAPAHAHMPPWRQYALLACAHAHRATRQLCAAAYHGVGAAHSASGVCTHDATETAHSRSHVCVHAHLTTSSHARRTHELHNIFFFCRLKLSLRSHRLRASGFHANLYKSDLQSFAKTTFARNPRRARPALPATPGRGQSQGYGLSRGHGLCQTLDSENERSADDDTQFLLWSINLYMPRDSPVRGRSGACQCKLTLLHHDNIHTCDISHFCSIICGAIVSESVTIVPPLPANQSRLVAC